MGRTDPMIGRTAERSVLTQALDHIGRGAAYAVTVSGEPGIGKTQLLGHLAGLARQRGLPVLAASPIELGRQVPYGPIVDMLWPVVADMDAATDIGELGRFGPLAAIFPMMAEAADAESTEKQPDRYRINMAVRALLEVIAPPGLVLIVDDLHWADEQTIDLLSYLLRRPPHGPVLLACAYRGGHVPPHLHGVVSGSGLACPIERLTLGPLSRPEADALLGERGSASWRRAVHEQAGGNPFYLTALALAERTRPVADPLDSLSLPDSVEAVILAELDRLSPAGRLVVRAAAVADGQFDPGLVADIIGCTEEQVLTGIDELTTADLVRPAVAPRCFVFRHPLVRKVVYDNAPPGWRLAAHGRAAATLQRRGGPVAVRAYHVGLAAQPGDRAAVSLLVEAARAARFHAPATAAQWLGIALNLLPDDAAAERMTLSLYLAGMLGAAGQLRACRDTMHQVLRLLPHTEPERRAKAVAACALMEQQLCRRAEGRALLLGEISALPDRSSLAAAVLWFALACSELVEGDAAAAYRSAAPALAAASRHRARPLQAAVLGLLAMASIFNADVSAATAHISAAASLMDGLLDAELAGQLDAVVWVGRGEALLERHDDAARHLDRALTIARTAGHDLALPHLLVSKVMTLRAAGRLGEAGECADEGVEVAILTGSAEQEAIALAMRCWISATTGHIDEALRAGETARTRSRSTSGWTTAIVSRMLAEARFASGDVAGCLALAEAGGGPGLPAADPVARVGWYELLTQAELAAGRPDAAARWAERASELAARLDLTGRTGIALLAVAQVHAATTPETALAPAVDARDTLTSAGLIIEALRARLVIGRALAAQGRTSDAAAELRAVQTDSADCGAQVLARQASVERRRIAARSSRTSSRSAAHGGLTPLTRRESEIASLVTEGLTNRQIAQRLYITEKTVEMHLSNMFAKLRVSSRAAVASKFTRAATRRRSS